MKRLNVLTAFIFASSLIFTSCKDNDPDPEPDPSYSVPTTYNFTNVDYSGQTTRLSMLTELVNKMKEGNAGTTVDGTVLKNMFANTGSPFASADLNAATTKQLKDKTFELDRDLFEDYMDSVAKASLSVVAGSNGVAGVVTSPNDATKKYLCNAKGFEYTQVVAKGLMGATFYYQVTNNYLTDAKIGAGVDNTTVTAGQGTPMEHHWDEAFGYLGVPIDFPTNKTGLLFWGGYSNQVDPATGSNAKIMNAFLKGRAAISNKDNTTKDAQAAIIIAEWERMVAAAAILELNKAKDAFADDAVRNHLLSEAVGFVLALKYNPSKTITDIQITTALAHIGDNLYDISLTDINNAIDEISTIYGMDDIKNIL